MTYPPPIASPDIENIVRSPRDLGEVARARRKSLALKQADLAGLASTGNRFVVDLEAGKPTLQLQKVLDMLNLLGLEVVVRRKSGRRPSCRHP